MVKGKLIFTFDPTKKARFGVLPRYAKDEQLIRWFDLPNCFIFHNGNSLNLLEIILFLMELAIYSDRLLLSGHLSVMIPIYSFINGRIQCIQLLLNFLYSFFNCLLETTIIMSLLFDNIEFTLRNLVLLQYKEISSKITSLHLYCIQRNYTFI